MIGKFFPRPEQANNAIVICIRSMDVFMGEVNYFTAQSSKKLLRKKAKISTMSDKVSGKQFIIRKSVV